MSLQVACLGTRVIAQPYPELDKLNAVHSGSFSLDDLWEVS